MIYILEITLYKDMLRRVFQIVSPPNMKNSKRERYKIIHNQEGKPAINSIHKGYNIHHRFYYLRGKKQKHFAYLNNLHKYKYIKYKGERKVP